VAAIFIILKEVLGVIATLFAPMHMRGVEVSLTDTLHAVLTAIGFGAFAF